MSANIKQKADEAMEKMKTGKDFLNLMQVSNKFQEFPISENPYFEKYAKKLAAAQTTSPEEFLIKLEQQKKKERKEQEPTRQYTELLNPKKPTTIGKGETPHKLLSDIMKLDLLEGKSIEELKLIWLEYHKDKEVLTATIPTHIFETLMENAKKFPIFIFPIPRSQGYEFMMFQFAANTVHFTPLLCYQVSTLPSLDQDHNLTSENFVRFTRKMHPNA